MDDAPAAKMGRPEKQLDWDQLDRVCSKPLKQDDVAHIMGISVDTLSRRIKDKFDCTFAEYIEQKRAGLRETLFDMCWESAKKGNATMQIWLTKNMLGFTDKTETSLKEIQPIQLNYSLDKPKAG